MHRKQDDLIVADVIFVHFLFFYVDMKKHTQNTEGAGAFYSAFTAVLAGMPERSRTIVAKRFGVTGRKPMTLQAIGNVYDITRERVRQIVQSGVRTAREHADDAVVAAVRTRLTDYLRTHHGIAMEETIIKELADGNVKEEGAIRFFIESVADVDFVNAKKFPVAERVVAMHDFDTQKWHMVHTTVKDALKTAARTHTSHALHKIVTDTHGAIAHDEFVTYLVVSREIGKNPFDKWGLVEWDEISPRGVREKALLVMKEQGTPMHFREIAAAIDVAGLGKNGRTSHPQTVHNELIRDKNFVLVGRGVYAIANKNYVRGTVKDVIEKVLATASEPLTAQDVIERVLAMRYVKPSTVRVNLNAIAKKMNKKYTLEKKQK